MIETGTRHHLQHETGGGLRLLQGHPGASVRGRRARLADFGLPPSEVAVHPSEGPGPGAHELYLMCEDIAAFVDAMTQRGLGVPRSRRWMGRLTRVTLPGGGTIGVYQPRHARPASAGDQA